MATPHFVEEKPLIPPVATKPAEVLHLPQAKTTTESVKQLIRYFTESGPDYEDWSPHYHMHFGFYRRGMNPFNREAMLQEMSRQVLLRLGIGCQQKAYLLDMGCGLGATSRYAPRLLRRAHITGITLVPWQVKQARLMTEIAQLHDRVRFFKADYTNTFFPDNHFDGLYAIESMCYASGLDKADFVHEAYRLLKPGQKLVVSDGFYKHTKPMNRFLRFCSERSSRYWALDTFAALEAYTEKLQQAGFHDIVVEEVSWRLVPSLLHVPMVALKFLFK